MEIRPLTDDHHSQWATLLALCFERSPQDMLALLNWLQKMGHVVAWGAWDADLLVAQYTSLLRHLCQNNINILAGMSINMAVHPDYRGQGLIKEVSAPVYDEIEGCGAVMGFGFSNAEGVKVDQHSKSYAYQVVGKLQSQLSFLTASHHTQLQLTATLPDRPYLAYDTQNPKLHFSKSLHTFRIRYGEHPFRQYQYGILYDNQDIQGIVVYRETQHLGINGMSLMDACGQNVPELLRRWGSTLKQNGYHFIHTLTTAQSDVAKNLCSTYPTLRLPYSRNPYYLTMRPISPTLDKTFQDFAQWDFIGGDIL